MSPEVKARFQDWPKGELIKGVAQKAGVRMQDIIGVWISMSCKPHSTAQGLNMSAGTGTGYYGGEEMTPEEEEGKKDASEDDEGRKEAPEENEEGKMDAPEAEEVRVLLEGRQLQHYFLSFLI